MGLEQVIVSTLVDALAKRSLGLVEPGAVLAGRTKPSGGSSQVIPAVSRRDRPPHEQVASVATATVLFVAIVAMIGFAGNAGAVAGTGGTTRESPAAGQGAGADPIAGEQPADPSNAAEGNPAEAPSPSPSTVEPPPPEQAPADPKKRIELDDAPVRASDSVGVERLDPILMAGVQVGAGALTLLGAGAVSWYFGIQLLMIPVSMAAPAFGPNALIFTNVIAGAALLALAAGSGALVGWVEWALAEWLGKQSLPMWQTTTAGAITALGTAVVLVAVVALAGAVQFGLVASTGLVPPLLVLGCGACALGCVAIPLVPAWIYFSNAQARGAPATARDEPRPEAGPRAPRPVVALAS